MKKISKIPTKTPTKTAKNLNSVNKFFIGPYDLYERLIACLQYCAYCSTESETQSNDQICSLFEKGSLYKGMVVLNNDNGLVEHVKSLREKFTEFDERLDVIESSFNLISYNHNELLINLSEVVFDILCAFSHPSEDDKLLNIVVTKFREHLLLFHRVGVSSLQIITVNDNIAVHHITSLDSCDPFTAQVVAKLSPIFTPTPSSDQQASDIEFVASLARAEKYSVEVACVVRVKEDKTVGEEDIEEYSNQLCDLADYLVDLKRQQEAIAILKLRKYMTESTQKLNAIVSKKEKQTDAFTNKADAEHEKRTDAVKKANSKKQVEASVSPATNSVKNMPQNVDQSIYDRKSPVQASSTVKALELSDRPEPTGKTTSSRPSSSAAREDSIVAPSNPWSVPNTARPLSGGAERGGVSRVIDQVDASATSSNAISSANIDNKTVESKSVDNESASMEHNTTEDDLLQRVAAALHTTEEVLTEVAAVTAGADLSLEEAEAAPDIADIVDFNQQKAEEEVVERAESPLIYSTADKPHNSQSYDVKTEIIERSESPSRSSVATPSNTNSKSALVVADADPHLSEVLSAIASRRELIESFKSPSRLQSSADRSVIAPLSPLNVTSQQSAEEDTDFSTVAELEDDHLAPNITPSSPYFVKSKTPSTTRPPTVPGTRAAVEHLPVPADSPALDSGVKESFSPGLTNQSVATNSSFGDYDLADIHKLITANIESYNRKHQESDAKRATAAGAGLTEEEEDFEKAKGFSQTTISVVADNESVKPAREGKGKVADLDDLLFGGSEAVSLDSHSDRRRDEYVPLSTPVMELQRQGRLAELHDTHSRPSSAYQREEVEPLGSGTEIDLLNAQMDRLFRETELRKAAAAAEEAQLEREGKTMSSRPGTRPTTSAGRNYFADSDAHDEVLRAAQSVIREAQTVRLSVDSTSSSSAAHQTTTLSDGDYIVSAIDRLTSPKRPSAQSGVSSPIRPSTGGSRTTSLPASFPALSAAAADTSRPATSSKHATTASDFNFDAYLSDIDKQVNLSYALVRSSADKDIGDLNALVVPRPALAAAAEFPTSENTSKATTKADLVAAAQQSSQPHRHRSVDTLPATSEIPPETVKTVVDAIERKIRSSVEEVQTEVSPRGTGISELGPSTRASRLSLQYGDDNSTTSRSVLQDANYSDSPVLRKPPTFTEAPAQAPTVAGDALSQSLVNGLMESVDDENLGDYISRAYGMIRDKAVKKEVTDKYRSVEASTLSLSHSAAVGESLSETAVLAAVSAAKESVGKAARATTATTAEDKSDAKRSEEKSSGDRKDSSSSSSDGDARKLSSSAIIPEDDYKAHESKDSGSTAQTTTTAQLESKGIVQQEAKVPEKSLILGNNASNVHAASAAPKDKQPLSQSLVNGLMESVDDENLGDYISRAYGMIRNKAILADNKGDSTGDRSGEQSGAGSLGNTGDFSVDSRNLLQEDEELYPLEQHQTEQYDIEHLLDDHSPSPAVEEEEEASEAALDEAEDPLSASLARFINQEEQEEPDVSVDVDVEDSMDVSLQGGHHAHHTKLSAPEQRGVNHSNYSRPNTASNTITSRPSTANRVVVKRPSTADSLSGAQKQQQQQQISGGDHQGDEDARPDIHTLLKDISESLADGIGSVASVGSTVAMNPDAAAALMEQGEQESSSNLNVKISEQLRRNEGLLSSPVAVSRAKREEGVKDKEHREHKEHKGYKEEQREESVDDYVMVDRINNDYHHHSDEKHSERNQSPLSKPASQPVARDGSIDPHHTDSPDMPHQRFADKAPRPKVIDVITPPANANIHSKFESQVPIIEKKSLPLNTSQESDEGNKMVYVEGQYSAEEQEVLAKQLQSTRILIDYKYYLEAMKKNKRRLEMGQDILLRLQEHNQKVANNQQHQHQKHRNIDRQESGSLPSSLMFVAEPSPKAQTSLQMHHSPKRHKQKQTGSKSAATEGDVRLSVDTSDKASTDQQQQAQSASRHPQPTPQSHHPNRNDSAGISSIIAPVSDSNHTSSTTPASGRPVRKVLTGSNVLNETPAAPPTQFISQPSPPLPPTHQSDGFVYQAMSRNNSAAVLDPPYSYDNYSAGPDPRENDYNYHRPRSAQQQLQQQQPGRKQSHQPSEDRYEYNPPQQFHHHHHHHHQQQQQHEYQQQPLLRKQYPDNPPPAERKVSYKILSGFSGDGDVVQEKSPRGMQTRVTPPQNPPTDVNYVERGGPLSPSKRIIHIPSAQHNGLHGLLAANQPPPPLSRPSSVSSSRRKQSEIHSTADEDRSQFTPREAALDVGDQRRERIRAQSAGRSGSSSSSKYTNFQQTKNAISCVCLAGTHFEAKRQEALDIVEYYNSSTGRALRNQSVVEESMIEHDRLKSRVHQFVIMFYKSKVQVFKGIYAVDPLTGNVVRIYGIGPKELPSSGAENTLIQGYMKYETASKSFKNIPVKGISNTVDAVILDATKLQKQSIK